jgi:hypothetical protein
VGVVSGGWWERPQSAQRHLRHSSSKLLHTPPAQCPPPPSKQFLLPSDAKIRNSSSSQSSTTLTCGSGVSAEQSRFSIVAPKSRVSCPTTQASHRGPACGSPGSAYSSKRRTRRTGGGHRLSAAQPPTHAPQGPRQPVCDQGSSRVTRAAWEASTATHPGQRDSTAPENTTTCALRRGRRQHGTLR